MDVLISRLCARSVCHCLHAAAVRPRSPTRAGAPRTRARRFASFTYGLYNTRDPRIVSAASQAHMINFTTSDPLNFGQKFYGMGTFSLDWSIGDGEAYGHVGDTYGYQSQTTYFPGMDFVISVATNVETSSQAQPADTTCLAYHALMAAMQGASAPTCTFTVPHRFIGTCTCTTEIVV